MAHYVVSDGTVISASQVKGKWVAFRAITRGYATPLLYKHALAFAYKSRGGEVLTENEFKDYKLNGEE